MKSHSGGRALATRLALVVWLAIGWTCAGIAKPDNVLDNGGFEKGEAGWQWQQWLGRALPGYIDRDDVQEGRASFRFHEDGVNHELWMAVEAKIEAGRDYELSLSLKPDQMPDGAARVRVLVDGRGWYGSDTGQIELVQTGGTHGWQAYTVPMAASRLGNATKVTIFIYHAMPSRGTLGVDAVALTPGAAGRAAVPRAPSPPDQPKAASYTTTNPAVLVEQADAPVAIQAAPDRALYRVGELPRITIRTASAADTVLTYRIIDGFGQTLLHKSASGAAVDVPLPPGHGYYEVIATLTKGGQVVGEARRSIGALPPPAKPTRDEPFGLWVQGSQFYPELGVRWVREYIDWNIYRVQGDKYLAERAETFKWYRDHNIRVLAYPGGHPNETSREVIADTPEAWRAEEEWWTKMVRTLGRHVDAWAVVNEPIRGHWQGSEALIVRYWTLMRRIVDRYDPGKPLVGPSLTPNTASIVEQYRDLLNMGFGKLIDAVEMHTYITSPEDNDWEGNTRRIRDMTRSATGRDLPVWSTEHGSSATYQGELLQAQHLMRSWLEAKKIGYPVVIWHMFSHPQGTDAREVQFGIFRNRKEGEGPPQPRPAAIAYGVMTRQLAGATYKGTADYFGPSVRAYVFERDGKAMMALWTTSPKTYDVTVSAGDEKSVTSTGLFGRTVPLEVRDGLVRVRVDRNPQFIGPLPGSHLRAEPIARLDKTIDVLPGASTQAALMLVNPGPSPARLRIEWQAANGWRLALPEQEWVLKAHERKSVTLTATASPDLPVGRYQIYAKVARDGAYVTSMAVQATVLPQVTITRIEPRVVGDRPMVAGTLRRIDPKLDTAIVRLDGSRNASTVAFQGRDEAAFAVPVDNPAPDRLSDVKVSVLGADNKVQAEESARLSFVAAAYAKTKPAIDGDLGDWPGLGSSGPLALQWRWDEQNLYLAVRVADATHIQKQSVTEMWKDDSVQIGLAPGRPDQLVRAFLPGLQETDMMELDVALRPQGPDVYRHATLNKHLAPVGGVDRNQIRRAVRHGAGVTTYELQIPVEQIGLKPLQAGQMLRVSLLVNANDGQGRRTTEWFSGIKEAKDPSLFGHLILAP
ncbi:MAG TPA: hypothetical protein VJR58_09200 [Vineibacter sp.]|nr:hypothetical protein [Vineibacter sp.]